MLRVLMIDGIIGRFCLRRKIKFDQLSPLSALCCMRGKTSFEAPLVRRASMPEMERTMLRKFFVVSTAVAAIAAFTAVSQPVQARSCNAILAKGRGLDEATASARSLKHLTNRINHWAAKNGLGAVSVGHRSTVCSSKGVSICTSSAKVCG